MMLARCLAAALIMGIRFSPTVFAEVPRPSVEVEARAARGAFTDMVAAGSIPGLLKSVTDLFVKTASDGFPCMNWQAKDSKEIRPKPSARLILVLAREGYGNAFRIRVSYLASVGESRELELKNLSRIVIEPLKEVPRPTGLDLVKELLRARITEQVSDESFEISINAHLISNIPLASDIELDGSRLIVPVNADSLKLAESSPLFISIKEASLCTREPEDCKVELLSLGPSRSQNFRDLLRCKVEKSGCCAITPEFTRNVRSAGFKDVFLGATHKHCSPFLKTCRSDGVSRKIGNSRNGRPS